MIDRSRRPALKAICGKRSNSSGSATSRSAGWKLKGNGAERAGGERFHFRRAGQRGFAAADMPGQAGEVGLPIGGEDRQHMLVDAVSFDFTD